MTFDQLLRYPIPETVKLRNCYNECVMLKKENAELKKLITKIKNKLP